MIVCYKDFNRKDGLLKIVSDNKNRNLYMYLDLLFYGPESKTTNTWIQIDTESSVQSIILRYNNSLQIMGINDSSDKQELSTFITRLNAKMISGDSATMTRISIPKYSISNGYLMTLNDSFFARCDSDFVDVETESMMLKAAKFVCSDPEIGSSHYSADELSKQYLERKSNWSCRNYVMLRDGEVICHIATYAESDSCAIIGGLLVHPKFRNDGLGGKALSYISFKLISENKKPFLFCYKDSLKEYYEKRGWIVQEVVSKLEKRT